VFFKHALFVAPCEQDGFVQIDAQGRLKRVGLIVQSVDSRELGL